MVTAEKKILVQDLRLCYGPQEVFHCIWFDVYRRAIHRVIGPATTGKHSFL